MTAGRFVGRCAVVTGAASGIGRATAHRFVADGGVVVAGDIDTEGLQQLTDDLGAPVAVQRCDVTREADVAALVDLAVERFGSIDAVFNVAGGNRPGLITETTESDWDFTVALCLKSVFFGVKHAARQMSATGSRGAIVNIASLNSRVPMVLGLPTRPQRRASRVSASPQRSSSVTSVSASTRCRRDSPTHR